MNIRSGVSFCMALMLFFSCVNHEEPAQKPAAKEVTSELFTVEIKGMKFIPDSIAIHAGDTIIFINRDLVDHCVTEQDSAWTTSLIASGEDHMVMAEKSSNYYCAIHKVMKGKIVVLPK